MKKYLLVLALLLAAPTQAQDAPPAYRLYISPGLAHVADGNQFMAIAGFERILVDNGLPGALAAGTEFKQVFGDNSVSSVTATSRWYFVRGGDYEVFALGNYAAQINEADVASFGTGVQFFVFPQNKDLGLRVELLDDISTDGGQQAAAVRVGFVFRF